MPPLRVTRETDSGNESTLNPIEIPPPRPKRKPVHPYPCKMVTLKRSLSTNMSISDQENQSSSPTSVLSAIGSDSTPNGSLSPVSSNLGVKEGSYKSSDEAENSSEDEQILDLLPHHNNCAAVKGYSNESNGQFLKLFGKTLVVADAEAETCKPESMCNNYIVSPTRVVARKISYTNTSECVGPDLPCLSLYSGASLSVHGVLSPTPIKAHLECSKIGRVDNEEPNESFSDPSDGEGSSTVVESSLEFKGQVRNLISSYELSKRISADSLKGFVPYKRCVMDRDSDVSSAENPDERSKQRICVEAN